MLQAVSVRGWSKSIGRGGEMGGGSAILKMGGGSSHFSASRRGGS